VDFSIIICCYNSSATILNVLEKIESIIYHNDKFEVLIIDNNSIDDTSIVVNGRILKSKLTMKLHNEPRPGLSNARKTGILNSKGKYFLFCDDDNLLDDNYLNISKHILDNDLTIGLMAGYNEPIYSADIPEWFLENQELYACGTILSNSGYVTDKSGIWGAGMVGRTSIMKKLFQWGFEHITTDRKGNNLSGGGDIEICRWHLLLGFKLWYESTLKLKHSISEERMKLDYLDRLKKGIENSAFNLWDGYDLIDKARDLKFRKKHLLTVFSNSRKGDIVRLKYGLYFKNLSIRKTHKAICKIKKIKNEDIISLFMA
jgi:glycosyltransferase involved in cell wall biosynthesis